MIVLLLTLLLTASAEAGEPSTICLADNSAASEECRRKGALKYQKWIYTDPILGPIVEEHPIDPCLAKMEAAMREGWPYIFDGKEFSYPYIQPDDFYQTRSYTNTQQQLGYAIVQDAVKREMEDRLSRITKLWTDAKRECWRQP